MCFGVYRACYDSPRAKVDSNFKAPRQKISPKGSAKKHVRATGGRKTSAAVPSSVKRTRSKTPKQRRAPAISMRSPEEADPARFFASGSASLPRHSTTGGRGPIVDGVDLPVRESWRQADSRLEDHMSPVTVVNSLGASPPDSHKISSAFGGQNDSEEQFRMVQMARRDTLHEDTSPFAATESAAAISAGATWRQSDSQVEGHMSPVTDIDSSGASPPDAGKSSEEQFRMALMARGDTLRVAAKELASPFAAADYADSRGPIDHADRSGEVGSDFIFLLSSALPCARAS